MEEREINLWKLHFRAADLIVYLFGREREMRANTQIDDLIQKDISLLDELIKINLPKIQNYKNYLAN